MSGDVAVKHDGTHALPSWCVVGEIKLMCVSRQMNPKWTGERTALGPWFVQS